MTHGVIDDVAPMSPTHHLPLFAEFVMDEGDGVLVNVEVGIPFVVGGDNIESLPDRVPLGTGNLLESGNAPLRMPAGTAHPLAPKSSGQSDQSGKQFAAVWTARTRPPSRIHSPKSC